MEKDHNQFSGTTQKGDKIISICCPNCSQKIGIYEKRIPRHEKLITRCKNCGHRFPTLSNIMFSYISDGNDVKKEQPHLHSIARTIAVCNSKEGGGKTTTAVNLSAGLALSGFKVLLVDTDTQGRDSDMLGIKTDAGLTELVTEAMDSDSVMVQVRENLWLLAGGNSLRRLKRIIDRKDFGGELVISETLEPLLGTFDYIIVDTSPTWDPLTVNVLFFVKEVLVPVALESVTLDEITAFLKSLSSIQRYRKEVALKYIVPTFYDRSVSSQGNILTRLVETHGDLVCSPIHYDADFADAPAVGQTTYEFAPSSTGTEDFKNLVRRVGGDDNLLRHPPTNDLKN